MGAAGAAELVATIGALRRSTLPPTIGLELPDAGLELGCLSISRRVVREPARDFFALSNSFGFGGHNAVLSVRVPPAPVEARPFARLGPPLEAKPAMDGAP
jgi:3-oxoacyl-(acyl-carrier-protein) synthase